MHANSKVQKAIESIKIKIFTQQSPITLENLREFGLHLISNYVCANGCFVLSTQRFKYEIWHKNKRKQIGFISKRRSGGFSYSQNNSYGRTADVP
jgi:hypothetical protein